jgi:hypothetical protein
MHHPYVTEVQIQGQSFKPRNPLLMLRRTLPDLRQKLSMLAPVFDGFFMVKIDEANNPFVSRSFQEL